MHVLKVYCVCKSQRHAPAGNNAYAANYHVNKEFMRHDKLERELYLLQLLTENRTYTIERLCEKLGISRRNLYYYLEFSATADLRYTSTATATASTAIRLSSTA